MNRVDKDMKDMDKRYLNGIRPLLEQQHGTGSADRILSEAWERYAQICAENINEPKEVRAHTRKQIYPACAAFEAMLKNGISREETAAFLNGYDVKRAEPAGAKIRRVMKIPGLYKLIPKFFSKMTQSAFGEAAGFRANWHSASWREMRFDMLVCPYRDKCVQYGCPEIVEGFCRADDIYYGNMHPRLKWERTKTLGMGGDCCDFKLTRL